MQKLRKSQFNKEQQYLRRAFNAINNDVDDHNKNFSFFMDQPVIWRPSPAYDITFSVDFAALAYTNKHPLMINDKKINILRKELEKVPSV